jgi:hypothetical protein
MTARRYAEDTQVPTGRTQGEIKDMLRKAGADRTAIYEGDDASAVAFTIRGRQYRMALKAPAGKTPAGKTPAQRAQDERRSWRLLLLLVKAKLEAVREGASTLEREFLADLVMPNGHAYETGQMPTTLLLEGPR